MKDRIKKVRKHTQLTQIAFGERIGVKGNTVTGWESGIRVPSDAIINSICREFGVDESWLRTGEGEMLRTVSRTDEISAFMDKALHGKSNDFKQRLIAVLARLDESEWELLEKMALKLVDEYQTQKTSTGHLNIIKVAGRDGSYAEHALTDDEMADLKDRLDQLPEVPDDL